jgi:hypothetical protein
MRARAALLLPLLLAGCLDGGTTDPRLEERVFTALGGLAVGRSLTLSGDSARELYLAGGAEGRDYLYVPFLADSAGSRTTLSLTGTNVTDGSGSAAPAQAPVVAGGFGGAAEGWTMPEDESRHTARLALAERRLRPRLSSARAARAARGDPGVRRLAVPATVGAAAVVRVPDFTVEDPCGTFTTHQGRVMAVSAGAIVVADSANPPNGFSSFDYDNFARQFDLLVSPVDTATFGAPTDLDGNGKVVIFFTRAVNEETEPGASSYVAGYFWPGDLFPRGSCPQSNEGEMFYMLVPDPDGVVNGNRFPVSFVRGGTVGTIGHEFQHLINSGRRMYVNDAPDFEQVWLDEGLSHIAEELIFYRASGAAARQNIDYERLVSTEVIRNAVNTYQLSNILRFIAYLRNPAASPLTAGASLGTRGAVWSFLRYAADRKDGDDRALFRALANSTTTGLANLEAALGADPLDWMRDWTISVFTDDSGVAVESRYTQPSWNFRSAVPPVNDGIFPLPVLPLRSGVETRVTLAGAAAAFVRLTAAPGKVAEVTAAPAAGASSSYRVTVVRLR